jgi:hypothetical protein
MGWRVAKSLLTLREQVDAMAPGRSKANDGTIGDPAHQARKSDHNPDANGVVTAMDVTNDPAHGADAGAIAEMLRLSKDRRIKYVISNRRIFSSLVSAWQWRPYDGMNAHIEHVHISVIDDPTIYDDTTQWALDRIAKTSVSLDVSRALGCANIVATVFGGHTDPNTSAYDGHLIDDQELGVALPFRFPDTQRPKIRVTNTANAKSTICNIVDVGPWNTQDPYWQTGARPQAESGTDMRGRPTNRAGIDLTPGTASAINISGKGQVNWEFATAAMPAQPQMPDAGLAILQLLQKNLKDGGIKMPLPADDVSNLLQQLFKLLQGAGAPTGPATTTTTTTTNPAQAADASDPTKQIFDLIASIIVPALGKQIPALGQVNGALGQTIGNLLDGKKTAIGIFGSLLSSLLPALSSSTGLLGGVSALVPQIGLPIFLAMAAWGVLGKLEKWTQGNVPMSPPSK